MRKFWIAIILLIILCSCSPTPQQIEKAINETQTANVSNITETPIVSHTPTIKEVTNTPKPTNTRRPTEAPQLGAYNNPFPAGEWVYLTMTTNGEKTEFRIRITGSIRGDEAWEIIKQANSFNEMPPNGFEAILIEISIKNTSPSAFLSLDKYDIALATKGNVTFYDFYSPCCLDRAGYPEFDAQLNPTGEHSGWIARAVSIDDNSPMIIIGADYDGSGGLYFSVPK